MQREVDPRDPRDVSAGVALSAVPVNAVILEPTPGQTVAAGPVRIRGWAMGSASRALREVEVSANEGDTWTKVRPVTTGGTWTWNCWEAVLDLRPGRHGLVVKATDASRATQPPSIRDTWNVKGYANNAWHRVKIVVE